MSFYTGTEFKTDFPTFVGSWSYNYKSWQSKELKNKCLLIKYEDLINQKENTIIQILEFIAKLSKIKLTLNKKKLENSIKTTDFEYLQNLEKEKGFGEAMISKTKVNKIKFFYLGPKNNWKKILNEEIKKKIEINFKNRCFGIQEHKYITGTFEQESEKIASLFSGVEGATRTFKML